MGLVPLIDVFLYRLSFLEVISLQPLCEAKKLPTTPKVSPYIGECGLPILVNHFILSGSGFAGVVKSLSFVAKVLARCNFANHINKFHKSS
jgi:hypothetical protein